MNEVFHIDVGGARISGEAAGSGSPVVFLHAGVGDHRMWNPQFDAFSKDYRTVVYDQSGFGKTTAPDAPFSHVNDLMERPEEVNAAIRSFLRNNGNWI